MKKILTLVFLFGIYFQTFAQPGDVPFRAEPGKCYAKCLVLGSAEKTDVSYPVYVGDNPESENLETIELILVPSGEEWRKNEETDAMCLVKIPPVIEVITYAKDTAQISEFVWETFTLVKAKRPGRHEWREVMCHDRVSSRVVKKIQMALLKTGIYKGELNGEIDKETKEALTIFQKSHDLPIGNLDMETIKVLKDLF